MEEQWQDPVILIGSGEAGGGREVDTFKVAVISDRLVWTKVLNL